MTKQHRIEQLRAACVALTGAALLSAAGVGAQAPAELVGDADRGRALYTTEYKCYACHGYDAQTGERRLLPMSYTQEGFITFVQRSPLPQMPAYRDMPAQALADVYAYLRSIPVDAPPVEDIPALKAILDAKRRALAE